MKRTFVIGDIHGALRALKLLMLQIDPQPTDRFIFLGDYVDGWSESAETIEWLVQFSKKYDAIFIKGNHDVYCENWLQDSTAASKWVKQGGELTMEGYRKFSDVQKLSHLSFFRGMKNYYIDENNRLFVHAGFSSMQGPEHEHYSSNFKWDRTLWEMAVTMDRRIKKDSKLYPKRLLLFNEIFIGHTPTLNYDITTPMNACNIWNLDTGAAFFGPLSAMNIETKEIFQTPPVYQLYPGEKGRNK